jgi:septal ring factor EnvC (AmiA/AmiB activator)
MDRHTMVCKEETIMALGPQPSHLAQDYRAPHAAPSSIFAKARTRRAILWGTVSTVLSAIGLIGLALFEQYNGMLSELRTDLKHFNETSSDYVKKDAYHRLRDELKELRKETQTANLALAQAELEVKASEKAREEMARDLQRMRERLAYLEGRQTATSHSAAAPKE